MLHACATKMNANVQPAKAKSSNQEPNATKEQARWYMPEDWRDKKEDRRQLTTVNEQWKCTEYEVKRSSYDLILTTYYIYII